MVDDNRINSGLSAGAFRRLNQRPRDTFRSERATPIEPGYHYMAADYGFVPLPGIGPVEFHGRPIGPGNTDTIYRRLEPLRFSELGTPETIPVELVALSVQSIRPVQIGRDLFDMRIQLTEGEKSFGEISVLQELLDDGSGIPNGLFHKNININFTAHFYLLGSDKELRKWQPQRASTSQLYGPARGR